MARTTTKRGSNSAGLAPTDRPSESKSSFDAGAPVPSSASGSTHKLQLLALPPDAAGGDEGEESAVKLGKEIERMQDRSARLGGLVARLGPALKLCRRREEEGGEDRGPGRRRRRLPPDGEEGGGEREDETQQNELFASEEVRAVRCSHAHCSFDARQVGTRNAGGVRYY